MAQAPEVVYVSAAAPVVKAAAPAKVFSASHAIAGFLALASCILLGLGAGGPWWSNNVSSTNYVWLAPYGIRECSSLGQLSQNSNFGCTNTEAFGEYQQWVGVLYNAQNPLWTASAIFRTTGVPQPADYNSPAANAFTTNVYQSLRTGAAMMAIGCILSFFACIALFMTVCTAPGVGGYCASCTIFISGLAFVVALIGAACAGGAVQTAGWPGYFNTGSWGFGWGMATGSTGVCAAFLAFVVVMIADCKPAKY